MTYPNTPAASADPDADSGTLPGDPAASVVARFRGLSGATVRVLDLRPNTRVSDYYAADCTGCLDSSGTYNDDGTLHGKPLFAARGWAVKHSEQCRALPQQTGETSARSECLETAARLLDRAGAVAFTDGGQHRTMTPADQTTVNTLSQFAASLVSLAEAYRAEGSDRG